MTGTDEARRLLKAWLSLVPPPDMRTAIYRWLAANPEGKPDVGALEFGGYLADAADEYLRAERDHEAARDDLPTAANDALRDVFRALNSAIYEFRKRAKLAIAPKPDAGVTEVCVHGVPLDEMCFQCGPLPTDSIRVSLYNAKETLEAALAAPNALLRDFISDALARLNAALASAVPVVPETIPGQWQPIETAPKDGREVLLTDGWHLAVARWDPDSWPDADQSHSCWSISDWHNDPIHLRGGYAAIRWMPLPAAPAVSQPQPIEVAK